MAHYRSCSKCGKIHPANYNCTVGRVYSGGKERELRKSHSWQKKSKEIRQDASGLCEVCRDQGVYTYKGLEVHHIEKVKDAPELLLESDNLICLCTKHHKMADKGELTKDYLRSLVDRREKEIPPSHK